MHPLEVQADRNVRISTDVAAQRLALLRQQLILHEIDAYIIPTADVHQVRIQFS